MSNENFITEVDVLDEAKDNFLTYSEEVLTDRAVPSAEDGLLSVQRKIIWTIESVLKMTNSSKYKKSASLVGSTLSTAYFHGDSSCYGAMCKMAQSYLMRYPLIDGDGNFGTQEGNGMEAASRYTNARPSKYADLMMNDFNKNVVPLKETYNGEYMEPVVLPSLFPNALVNGLQTIAIGLAHNSLPNNLTEVCNAIIRYIENGNNITIDELLSIMPGPDFPLENVIINKNDIRAAFETGKSKVSLKVRGIYEIKGNKIIFTTIPYRTYRNKIKEQINNNIDELDKYIADFDDESNLGKNKLIFTVKAGIDPEEAVMKLFELTDLQTTLSYNMNYIVNGTPKLCSMIDLIHAYVEHQTSVLIKAAEYDKNKAEARKHIIEGLLIAIEDIDTAIKIIKSSNDKNTAAAALIEHFDIDDEQAKAILDMKLVRLTKLNKDDLLKELNEKIRIIKECTEIITNEDYRSKKLIDKISVMRDKYGDKRRTQLLQLNITYDKDTASAIIPEDVVVIMTKNGNIKRIPKKNFKTQRRNGKGVKTLDDALIGSVSTNTIDSLMLFSNKGKMYKLSVDKIPSGTNASKGTNIATLIKIDNGENITTIAAASVKDSNKYVVFFTKKGMIKKTSFDEYSNIKKTTGIQAIKIRDDDELVNVDFLNDEQIVVVTKEGRAIKFDTTEIAPIGRYAVGVKAINLKDDDEILNGIILKDDSPLAIFTADGGGKRISLSDIPLQRRAGVGIYVHRNGNLINALQVKNNDNLLIVGSPNSICIQVKDIPVHQKDAACLKIIKDSTIDKVVRL